MRNITVAALASAAILVAHEKPLADLDKKWAASDQQAQNWLRMVYSSFKRS